MKIFSVALGKHDHNTYDGVWHNQLERHTRIKHNINNGEKFYQEYWNPKQHDIFAFTTTIGGVKQISSLKSLDSFIDWTPNFLWDYKRQDNLYYIDHHQSHAAYARITSGFKECEFWF